ncbi:hypothetical protein SAY87_017859 [Trapa incisa]|uniref:Uncharacterized protein n=1 Tax=Trapa incisa TaxID=236973 RepID=A0AAN7L1F9_9MYRT|nr:hypothetical protein SAY87_017859 [Trapa incisa]
MQSVAGSILDVLFSREMDDFALIGSCLRAVGAEKSPQALAMLLLVSLICLPLDQPIALTTFLADLAFNLRLQLWSKLLSSYYTWRPWHEKYGEEQIQFKMWRQPFGRLTAITQLAHHGMIFVPIGYAFGSGMFEIE